MKTVLLAGGLGSRISEESHLKPKPMIEIGGMPILWHIMKTYAHYGFNDFIICAGYMQIIICIQAILLLILCMKTKLLCIITWLSRGK